LAEGHAQEIVRDVEMAAVRCWTGVETEALRQAMRLSIRVFAARLGVNDRTVIKWKARGSSLTLRPATQQILDCALGLVDEEVRGRFWFFLAMGSETQEPDEPEPLSADDEDKPSSPLEAAHTAPTYQAVISEAMRRRTLMTGSAAAATAASLGASAGTTTTTTRSVGMADVRRLQRSAVRLRSLGQRHGGVGLWQAALVQADDGVHMLEYGTYTDTVEQHLLVATGRLQICAGRQALDAGQHEVAWRCFSQALAKGRQANDAQIETPALANLALQSIALSRPREAVRYAAGAEQAATGHGATSWLVAIPQLRLATGSSLMGNAADADRAIAQARRVLDNNAPDEEWWPACRSPVEVDRFEATCAINLQRPAHAERLLEHTIASYPTKFAGDLALSRARLACARLDMGAVDGAAEAAHAALDDLTTHDVASWFVATELDAVAKRLAAYPEVDGVESFLARHQAMN
jgi:hypothetical protein